MIMNMCPKREPLLSFWIAATAPFIMRLLMASRSVAIFSNRGADSILCAIVMFRLQKQSTLDTLIRLNFLVIRYLINNRSALFSYLVFFSQNGFFHFEGMLCRWARQTLCQNEK